MPDELQQTALWYRSRQCLSKCQHDEMLKTASDAANLCNQMLAEKQEDERKRNEVSQALWCDTDLVPGGHAFSARDRNKQRYTISYTDSRGQEITETRDTCGQHAVVKPQHVRELISAEDAAPDGD